MLELSGQEQVQDLAVKAAFRAQPLGNSVYVPGYNVGKVSSDQVRLDTSLLSLFCIVRS